MPATGAEVPEAIRRYFDGLNNEDWEDFTGIWTDDAELVGVGARTRNGRDDVMTYYSTVLVPYPVHHDDPYAIHVAGDIVTVEIHFSGETHERVAVEFEAVDVFTLRDGKIARLTTWYDIDRVRKLAMRPGAPERRLQTLVRHAAAKSPYYGRRFEELGLDPEAVAREITLLPPTTEATSALAAMPLEKAVQLQAGDGYVLPLTASDVEEFDNQLAAALAVAGVTSDDAIVPLVPHRAVANAARQLKARLVVPVGPGAAPSVATVALAPAHSDVADANPEVRFVVGVAPGVDRQLLGRPETGVFAASCGESIHALASPIVEIVDGEILVTPLGRRGSPILRFAVGTRAEWVDGPCSCGSELRRLRLT